MSSVEPDNSTAGVPDTTGHVQENGDTALPLASQRAWYASLNEDWLATLFGLLLVILLVIGLLHSIP